MPKSRAMTSPCPLATFGWCTQSCC